MSTVYTLHESVQYEGSRLLNIYSSEQAALEALDKETSEHRYDGNWERWSTEDEKHILSAARGDVTFVVREREVLE